MTNPYPKFLYHPTKDAFICPSEEFHKSLTDADEYEELPFTGDRKIEVKKGCVKCTKLALELADTKLEVERLRAAMKIDKKTKAVKD